MTLKINEIIHQTLLSVSLNQSIGRNQAYRDNGNKAVVVLPILHPIHKNVISRNIDLNYISSNIKISA